MLNNSADRVSPEPLDDFPISKRFTLQSVSFDNLYNFIRLIFSNKKKHLLYKKYAMLQHWFKVPLSFRKTMFIFQNLPKAGAPKFKLPIGGGGGPGGPGGGGGIAILKMNFLQKKETIYFSINHILFE